jgi:DNA invertase Pin-like site-specific DNA recombinase
MVYRDLDVSGGKLKGRNGYAAMLKRIESGPVAVVAAYDQSRAFRNTADALNFYALMERRAEIAVAFVHGSFDRTPVGEFTYTTLAAAHAMERRMTVAKVAATYENMNASGAATGMPPYGLRWKDDRSGWEHDPERAKVVGHIFDLYANTGASAKVIAQVLNRGHQPVPTRAGTWMPDTVVDVLRNPAYAGLKYKTAQARRARNASSLIPAAWQPVIDRPTWDRVQRVMNRRQPRLRKSKEPREYMFQGLLWCRSCGQPMRSSTKYGIAYYQCRRDLADACAHGSRSIREDRLRPWADYLFGKLAGLAPADFADAIRAASEDDRVQAVDAIREIEAQQQRVARRYELGHVDEAAYQQRWDELERLKELWQATPAQQQVKPSLPIANLAAGWARATPRQSRDLLALLFEKLWIRRTHDTKWDAEHGQEIDVIDTYVPRSDYPFEVVGLVSLLVGAEGYVSIEVPAVPTPGRPTFAESGKGGLKLTKVADTGASKPARGGPRDREGVNQECCQASGHHPPRPRGQPQRRSDVPVLRHLPGSLLQMAATP